MQYSILIMQTRERDVDIVDALNTALGQYMIFSPGDSSIQRRTLLEMFTNDTGMWTQVRVQIICVTRCLDAMPPPIQWLDFKTSSVITAREHALFTGASDVLSQLWSDNDESILVRNAAIQSTSYVHYHVLYASCTVGR